MTQFARPEADTFIGNFEDELEGTTDIFQSIDETVADDDDYIASPADPDGEVYVTKLSETDDPEVSTGHIVRYRYSKDLEGGSQVNLTVQLREGYTNETDFPDNAGDFIAEWTHEDISHVPTTVSQTLGADEANSITMYDNLYLRFVFTTVIE